MKKPRRQNQYDHCLKELVRATNEIHFATRAGVNYRYDLDRLLDGTKDYLHAVIDNDSRRILGWPVADNFDPENTIAVLRDAVRGSKAQDDCPTVMTDAGVDNVNKDVDSVIDSGLIKRVIAQTEFKFSNSMIETWWRVVNRVCYANKSCTTCPCTSVRRISLPLNR